jgi:ABC-2 type transport system permease protein
MPIFDQGYQHWSGRLSGHAWRWLAITRHGVRVGLSGRVLRIFLIVAFLPALILASMLCLWGMVERQSEAVAAFAPIFGVIFGGDVLLDPRNYRVEVWTLSYRYFLSAELWITMILVMLIGPNLISQDLRFNALPLYFSRPLRRIDYFLGKLGVIAAFIGMVVIVPSIMTYVLGLLFSLDYTILKDTCRILFASVIFGVLISLSAGVLMLALSSLSRNSRYVALFWLGLWIVSGVVATVLGVADYEERRHQAIQTLGGGQLVFENRGSRQALDDLLLAEMQKSAKTNWRPLTSYQANLSHIGNQLLGTNAAVDKLSRLQRPRDRLEFTMAFMDYQFPWQWSAAVLAALFVLSACILTFSIKSLDRLK